MQTYPVPNKNFPVRCKVNKMSHTGKLFIANPAVFETRVTVLETGASIPAEILSPIRTVTFIVTDPAGHDARVIN